MWVVQNNLYNESEYERMLEALERFGIEHIEIKVVPFVHDLVPEVVIDPGKNVLVMGTTTLVKIAKKRGWIAFFNDNFDHDVWVKNYGRDMLNFDAKRIRFDEVVTHGLENFFIRPAKDNKIFTGKLYSIDEFKEWSEKILSSDFQSGFTTLRPDTEVVIASPKKILQEYRLFIVDGKIVTSSLYKIGSTPRYDSVVDEDVLSFGSYVISKWVPDEAFVLDVARVEDGLKIVEINCINNSGLYACDSYKLVQALDEIRKNFPSKK